MAACAAARPARSMATMRTATLELLERAKLPPEQALALAQAIDLEVASQREAMASRTDFLELRGEFRTELTPLKADVAQLKVDVAQLKVEVTGLKRDMVQLRDELREWKSEIRVEMHGVKAELIRWVFTVMLGQTAVLLGGGYFILSHLLA